MTLSFEQLTHLASEGNEAFRGVSRQECVTAARAHHRDSWERIRARHAEGEPGGSVLKLLTHAADELVQGIVEFGLFHAPGQRAVLSRVCICALGGYGRGELSPCSDLDICLLHDKEIDQGIESLNEYLLTFLWDMGFQIGYSIHQLSEALSLARQDPKVFTTYAQARQIMGDTTTFARLRLLFADLRAGDTSAAVEFVRGRVDPGTLPLAHREMYASEPDIKENMGGLRDYHAAHWLILLHLGPLHLEDLERSGHITPVEHLETLEGADFLWRIRNELHFHTGKPQNRITFALQRHAAQRFGYGSGTQVCIDRFMQDYYTAAKRLRRFLHIAVRICEHQTELDLEEGVEPARSEISTHRGRLCAGMHDKNWFVENPARLMELFWECSRRGVPLSAATQERVAANLSVVGEAFRGDDLVKRFFLAICNRPIDAGFALRQCAQSGLLGAYMPEFEAVHGIVRYEDFHSYPVEEHTLRAIEALAEIPLMEGPVGGVLQRTLEHIRNPHILVMAILLHDLGKASGEEHVEQGVQLARGICQRMGIPEDDAERILFLVRHHMLMTHMSMYRDTDDVDSVNQFAETMKTDERLRKLLLLSYADLRAVGPNVWTEWKGALLLKLFLKAERILLGRAKVSELEDYWNLPKAKAVAEHLPGELHRLIEPHLRGLGERYFVSFPADTIASHIECVEDAKARGLGVRCSDNPQTGMSEIVVCTQDRHGLFAQLAGSLASQLMDVGAAALFTTPDGFALDCFVVRDAANERHLTEGQIRGVTHALEAVLLRGADVQALVEMSRRRLFALFQPTIPVPTVIEFDNTSSRTDTVIDIETGDRTGLLYDMARGLADLGVDFMSARIVTDARLARDSFYVRLQGRKLEGAQEQAAVRERLQWAIQQSATAEQQGD